MIPERCKNCAANIAKGSERYCTYNEEVIDTEKNVPLCEKKLNYEKRQ